MMCGWMAIYFMSMCPLWAVSLSIFQGRASRWAVPSRIQAGPSLLRPPKLLGFSKNFRQRLIKFSRDRRKPRGAPCASESASVGGHRSTSPRCSACWPSTRTAMGHRRAASARGTFLVGGVAFRTVQMRDIGLLGLNEGIIKRLRDPRIFLQYVGLYRNQPVDRIDTGAPEPVGFSLGSIWNELRIDLGRLLSALLPRSGRWTRTSDARGSGEAGLQFATRHHAGKRLAIRSMDDIRR